MDVAADGALTARVAARLPSGVGSPGLPVARGLRVADGTLTMNSTFAAPTDSVSSREEAAAGAPALTAPTALTGFIRGKAEFDELDLMFGDLFSRQHLPGHAGMSAAFQATTAFKLTGGAGSVDRSAAEAHTVVAATLWSAPGASLSFAARGSFAFPCTGHARLATTATLRLGGGFSSGEHTGVLKWACGAPAAGEPKAVVSGVIAAPAAVGGYRFLGQSHYSAQATVTVASGAAGSEVRWSGVLEGTLAAAVGTHASTDVLRLSFDAHLGTFGLAAVQKTARPRDKTQSVCLTKCLCVICDDLISCYYYCNVCSLPQGPHAGRAGRGSGD